MRRERAVHGPSGLPSVMDMPKSQQPEPTDTLPPDAKQVRAAEIMAELAAYDSVELPPEVREWLDQLIGCINTSFSFDPETYFDEQAPYD